MALELLFMAAVACQILVAAGCFAGVIWITWQIVSEIKDSKGDKDGTV